MKRKIVLEKGLDGYIIACCPSCKGCVTQGRTEEGGSRKSERGG